MAAFIKAISSWVILKANNNSLPDSEKHKMAAKGVGLEIG